MDATSVSPAAGGGTRAATPGATDARPSSTARQEHWEMVYGGRDERQLSWYQGDPDLSARLVTEQAAALPSGQASAVVDAGGGSSALAGRLAADGFTDLTVVDIARPALSAAARRSGGDKVVRIQADLLTWRPPRRYQIWHDRAVFHFLTEPADRAAYLATLRAALSPGGAIIIAAFSPDGPAHCSGLPVARYDASGLAAELTASFGDAITITGQHAEEHHTPSGAIQPFTWITARLA
ncbi:MAG TPA: class I SAM-dependent methyltransferase [Trebonia sp.]